jgi:hypothetical protein
MMWSAPPLSLFRQQRADDTNGWARPVVKHYTLCGDMFHSDEHGR